MQTEMNQTNKDCARIKVLILVSFSNFNAFASASPSGPSDVFFLSIIKDLVSF